MHGTLQYIGGEALTNWKWLSIKENISMHIINTMLLFEYIIQRFISSYGNPLTLPLSIWIKT